MLVEIPRKEITFCKFFSEGGSGCAFGDSCKYPHIDATGKEARENWSPKRISEPLGEVLPTQNEAKEPVSLLVERVPPGTTETDLQTLFEQYGAVQVRLDTRPDGFGLAKVDYAERDSARAAFAALNASDNPNQFRVSWKKDTTGGPVRQAILYYPPHFATLPPRPCKFFFEGPLPNLTCRQGPYCAFRHGDEPRYSSYPIFGAYPYSYPFIPPIPFALPIRKVHKPELYKTMPCSNFAKGSCSFGDKCNFIH